MMTLFRFLFHPIYRRIHMNSFKFISTRGINGTHDVYRCKRSTTVEGQLWDLKSS